MTYVPPLYPTTIPTVGDLPDRVDDVDWLYAARYNELKKELRAALTELGTTPKGASADVAARLATLAPKASPVFTGQATIPTINLTGGQIVFPASRVASANANTMDDYEWGSWSGELRGTTTRADTPAIVYGLYLKSGDFVYVTIAFDNKDITGATGQMQITGLPYVPVGYSGAAIGFALGVVYPTGDNVLALITVASTIVFYSITPAGTYANLAVPASTGKYLYVAGSYITL